MKEFLKALVIPSKMKRFRYMSILIAMLIFVVSIYAITIPHNIYINNHKEKFISESSYVSPYQKLEEQELEDEIKNHKYKVVKDAMTSSVTDTDPKVYSYNSDAVVKGEEKNINIYFVFDQNSLLLDRTDKIKKAYLEKYPDAKNSQSIAYLIYIDELASTETVNDAWYQERFEHYNGLSTEDLSKVYKSKNNFELYGIKPTGDNNYLVIFLKDQLITQIPVKDEKTEEVTYPALTAYYSNCNEMDFSQATNLNEFGAIIADGVFKALKETDKTQYLLNAVVYTIIFPAIYCLLLFWCMRKRGTMKTFKEYYNIASITSIIPTIITFIGGWFIPNPIIIYGVGFSVFTLFTFYKINLTPEQGV